MGDPKMPNHKRTVEVAIREALAKAGTECEGMKCTVECAKQMKCLDGAIESKCKNVVRGREMCEIECTARASRRAGASVQGALLLAVCVAVSSGAGVFGPRDG